MRTARKRRGDRRNDLLALPVGEMSDGDLSKQCLCAGAARAAAAGAQGAADRVAALPEVRLVDALDRAGSPDLQRVQAGAYARPLWARLAGENMLRAAFKSRLGPTDRKKLIAGIHAQAKTLRLDSETRREMQRQLVGVESSKDMSLAQLSAVWSRLTALAQDAGLSTQHSGLSTRRKRPGRDERQPDELVTEEQTTKINELFDALGIAAVGQARINLSRRTCGSTWPQTREQANKIVEALKAMMKRGWKAKSAAGDEMPRRAPGDTVHESTITP